MAESICGSIPTKINIYFTDLIAHNVGSEVRHYTQEETMSLNPKDKSVLLEPMAFVEDVDDSFSAAARFAKVYSRIRTAMLPAAMGITNSPVSKIKIINKFGSNGGAKVLINDGSTTYVSNIDGDVLIDAALSGKIKSNGFLKGDYIWAKVRGKAKLIRVHGEMYDKVVRYQTKKNLPKLSKDTFVKGNCYRTLTGSSAVFVGMVDTTLLIKPRDTDRQFFHNSVINDFRILEKKKAMLFLHLRSKNPSSFKLGTWASISCPVVKFSHSFIEDANSHCDLPDNFLSTIKKATVKEIINRIKTAGTSQYAPTPKHLMWANCEILNMRDAGQEEFIPFDIRKLLNFI